jgi:hypothetical protein
MLVCDKPSDGKFVTSRICGGGCKPGPICDPGKIGHGTRCAKNDRRV